jgi:hypothetical protein
MAQMSASKKSTVSPAYCPTCQRLYRATPGNYTCSTDGTPLIDVGDPLPPSKIHAMIPLMGVLVTLSVAVGVGLTVT